MCICFVFFCFAPVDNFSCYYFSIEYLQQTSQTRKKKNIIDGFSAFTRAQEGRDVGGGQMVGGHYTNSTHARKPSVMLTAGCIQFGIAEKKTHFFLRVGRVRPLSTGTEYVNIPLVAYNHAY